jgi:hypothetical protein
MEQIKIFLAQKGVSIIGKSDAELTQLASVLGYVASNVIVETSEGTALNSTYANADVETFYKSVAESSGATKLNGAKFASLFGGKSLDDVKDIATGTEVKATLVSFAFVEGKTVQNASDEQKKGKALKFKLKLVFDAKKLDGTIASSAMFMYENTAFRAGLAKLIVDETLLVRGAEISLKIVQTSDGSWLTMEKA